MEYSNQLFSFKKLKERMNDSQKVYKKKIIKSGKFLCHHQYRLNMIIERENSRELEFECVKCKKIISFEWE